MLAAERRIRGIVKTMPLRTFSGNTNCSGGTTRRSGFSYDWYRLKAPGSVFLASAVESANLVLPFLQFVENQLNPKKGSLSVPRNGVVTHFRPFSVFESGWNWLSYCWGHAVRPVLVRVIRLQSLAEVQSFFLAFLDSCQFLGQVCRPKNLHAY